ncbi:MAG TPA: flagellar basal body FlgE domain-containing protein [Polyangiales bacterium]
MGRSVVAAAMAIAAGCTTAKVHNVFEHAAEAGGSLGSIEAGTAPIDGASDRPRIKCPADGGTIEASDLTALGYDLDALRAPLATAVVSLAVNLDVRASVPSMAWDATSAATSSNFPSSVTVYDSLGHGHLLTTYFAKTSTNTWDWHALANGSEIEGGISDAPFEGAHGTLSFNTDGALQSAVTNGSRWNFKGAASDQAITFHFGKSLSEGGTGVDGTTNFAGPSTTNGATQDGYAAGEVIGVTVSDGVAVAMYKNGQRRPVGPCP